MHIIIWTSNGEEQHETIDRIYTVLDCSRYASGVPSAELVYRDNSDSVIIIDRISFVLSIDEKKAYQKTDRPVKSN